MCPSLDDDRSEDDRTLLSLRDRQLRTVFEMALDAIAIADDEGRYLDVNPAACELFGLEKDELLGCCISDFTEPGFNFQQVWQEFQQPEQDLRSLTKETGFFLRKDALQPADSVKNPVSGAPCVSATEKLRGEFQLVRADGNIRIMEYAATANFLPHRHLSVMRDITERKQAEAKVKELTQQLDGEVSKPVSELEQTQAQLRESQQRMESIITDRIESQSRLEQIAHHIPGVIYQFRQRPDGTFHFPYSSEGMREIYGVSPEEVREDASKVFSVIHPDDLDRVSQSILDSAEHLTPWYCEYRVCLPDGRMLWLLGQATPQREPDGSTLSHGYIRDITDSKATEIALQASNSRWQLAIESAGDGTWDWNIKTNEIIFSRQWKAMLGYAEDEITNALEEWDIRCHPDDKFQCYEEVAKHLNGKTSGYCHEHRVRCKDGSYKWILARGRVVEWDLNGEPLRFIGTHSDISARKATELELEQFFSLALDLLCIADANGHFRRLNSAWEKTLGYSIQELEGQRFLDFVHPDDIPATLKVMADLSDQKSITQFTNRYRAKDGTYRYIEWRSTPCGDVIYAAARDITEHKLAEAKLNEISDRLSLALKSGAIGCWEWDIVQNTLVWDDRMYELYGVTKDCDTRLLYEIWSQGLHPDDREASETLIRQAVLGQAEFDPEFRVVHPDGSIHFIKAFGLVGRDAEGNPQKMIGVNFDISDRKQAEALLQQSQKRYETLAEASPIGVFLTDAQGNCLYVNQTWLQTSGLTQAEALADWSKTLHLEDRERVFKQWYENALSKQQFQSEYRFLRPDNTVAWVIGQALPLINSAGEIEGYVGTITDISDRKRQEQALRLIVEGTAAKTGADFFKSCVQYLAQVLEVRYAVITEYIDSEKSLAKTLAFWAGDGFGDSFTCNLTETPCKNAPCKNIHSNTEVYRYQFSQEYLDNQDSDLICLQAKSYAGLPIIDADGNRLGLLAVLDNKPMKQDLEMQSAILKIFATRAGAEIERLQAEAALRESEIQLRRQSEELAGTLKRLQNTQTQLIQAEKMSSLGQLVAGIAHEINNPVSFIYSNIQPATDYASDLIELIHLYQQDDPSPAQAIYDFTEDIDLEYLVSDFSNLLKSMKNGATRIRDIVKSLRTFSRLDEADLKPIDIHENIESTLVILQNRLNGRAGKPEIHLIKNYGKLPLVECYGGLLNQVFMNLLVNAIDAIEQQRSSLEPTERLDHLGEITITTSITPENQVIISIQDNACGISPEVQEKIFNPFFTTKPVGKGTGMGLATSYQIVTENHRGNLRCFSTPGEGTKFAIELPISNLELR